MADGALTLFFSYSHQDETLRNELANHLKILEYQGIISGWHDRKILPGSEWDRQINENLNSADIILLLVSSDFTASSYCWDVEVKTAINRHDRGEACVIPIILRDCSWTTTPFAKLQSLPKDAQPVIAWHNRDAAFKDITTEIQRAAIDLVARKKEKALTEYRQKVEEFAEDGEISVIESFILKDLRDALKLISDEEANEIRDNALRQYGDYAIKLDQYKQFFLSSVDQHGYPFSEKLKTEMKLLQAHLKIKDEDVKRIEDSLAPPTVEDGGKADNDPYVQLRDLLKAGKWNDADWETCRVMHLALGKSQIRVKDLKNFPCEALVAIDRLWQEYSNNKFGFSVQAKLWQELNGNEAQFDVRVGWRLDPTRQQKRYKSLMFNLDAPVGHFPAFFKSWGGGGWSWTNYLLSRAVECFYKAK